MRIQAWFERCRVGVWPLVLTGAMLTGSFAVAEDEVLFETSFEGPLEGWRLEPPEAFPVVESGDGEHRGVLEMRPHGAQTHALLPGSEQWQSYRIEGEVLFPPASEGSSPHNYLGFIYHLQEREGGRIDLGSVYIKGNGSYIRANPRRDWNPARMLYEEYRTALTGDDAIVIGEWQRFAVEVDGSDFHLYVGDLDVPKVTFDLYEGTNGAAGFKPRVVGGPVWLDNLRVTRIPALRYQGPRRPEGIDYHPERLVTDWEVLGPLSRAYPEVENDPAADHTLVEGGRELSWRPFETDIRGAVVTARVVDFVGPDAVAYFRTRVTTPTRAHFEISSIDDTAIWVDERFVGYGYAARFAWHDFGDNPEHATDDRVTLEPGTHTVTIRVRGGRYAAGGFFARVVKASEND